MRDLIGRTLGHYRIVEKIGEGGMGEVYRAHHERLDRDVAIKVLPERVAANTDRLRRFEREAKAVASLSHSNILEIFDFDTEGDVTYAVTELLEGETLREHLQESRGPLPWRQVQEIGAAVANGLGAAHGKGVVHRDIKPSNIFLCSDERVKILDFGLAATHEVVDSEAETGSIEAALTHEGSVMGTVGYMAPEQVRGEPADPRTDIFAFGCVLYEMLTGERAFKRDTAAEIMTAILREEPPSLAESGVQVTPDVAKAVQHCLEKNPERRFQSAADLAFALGSESEVTASTAMPSEISLARRWMMPMLAIAGIVVVALGMVFGPGILERFGGQPEQPPIRSIALLPLENLTGDPEQAYFVDGLHDELITTFAQISAFDKVIGRTSVMGFRDSDTPIREIGERLGVDAVLEGSVRQAGDTVRTAVQLIDARTEENLWAESFDRNLTDILVLQSEVARAVAREISLSLTPDDDRRLAGSRVVDEEAYRLYLRGARLSRLVETPENLGRAQDFFERAVEKDPEYAEPHVGLARVFLQLGHYYYGPTEFMPKVHAAALRAVELDDSSADAHALLGAVKLFWEWDWAGAETALRRAVALNPGNWEAALYYANYLVLVDRPDEAVAVMQRASELDPLNVLVHRGLGWIYGLTGRFDEGIEHMVSTLELYPNDAMAHYDLAVNYAGAQRYDEASQEIDRLMELAPAFRSSPIMLATLIWTHVHAGRRAEAKDAMERLRELSEVIFVAPSSMAFALLSLGEIQPAIEHFEKAYEIHDTQLLAFALAPELTGLSSHPGIQGIFRRMNYPGG